MTGSLEITLAGEQLLLLIDRGIYWPAQKALLIADVHLGKMNHFRKHGLAVPELVGRNNLWRLSGLLDSLQPEWLIFLGDLFHSAGNKAWPEFVDFIAGYPTLKRTLVAGNHDVLGPAVFAEAKMDTVDTLSLGPFLLSHDRVEHENLYNLHGHIHPGVRLRGGARQGLTLPCYHFDEGNAVGVLPSFGDFTGLYKLPVRKGHRVYVCAGAQVVSMA